MPKNRIERVSDSKQRAFFKRGYDDKNWSLLENALDDPLYNLFLTSEDTLLHDLVWGAYEANQVKFVENILQKINPNTKSTKGETLLFRACKARNSQLVSLLLKYDADPLLPIPPYSRETILKHIVGGHGDDFELIDLFVQHFNNKHHAERSIWDQPIWEEIAHLSLHTQAPQILETLLKNGVNPNGRDILNDTLLIRACEVSNAHAISLLLQYKADPLLNGDKRRTMLEVLKGVTFYAPLDFEKYFNIIELFIKYFDKKHHAEQSIWKHTAWEAIAHLALERDIQTLETLLKNGVNPNARSAINDTLLRKAYDSKDPRKLSLLLQYEADPLLRGFADKTLLDNVSAVQSFEVINNTLIGYFDKKHHAEESIWNHPIWEEIAHLAVKTGALQTLESLLENGINPNTRDMDMNGVTLLYLACRDKRQDIVYLLLQYKADPHLKGDNKPYTFSPFKFALAGHSFELMKPFLEHDKEYLKEYLHEKDEHGNPLLHRIIINGYASMEKLVPFLLRNGAKPNFKNSQGDTALHLAVNYKNLNIAKRLTSHLFMYEADFDCKNNQGETPLQLASQRPEVIGFCEELLYEAGIDAKEFKLSKQDVCLYARSVMCLSEHECPNTISQSFFLMLYWSLNGIDFRKKQSSEKGYLPPEVVEIILKHYFTTLDSLIDSPYKISDYCSVPALQNALKEYFFKINLYCEKKEFETAKSALEALSIPKI